MSSMFDPDIFDNDIFDVEISAAAPSPAAPAIAVPRRRRFRWDNVMRVLVRVNVSESLSLSADFRRVIRENLWLTAHARRRVREQFIMRGRVYTKSDLYDTIKDLLALTIMEKLDEIGGEQA